MRTFEDADLRIQPRSYAAAHFFSGVRAAVARFSYRAVVLTDPCAYCNTRNRNRTRDHIRARCLGGQLQWWNMAPACNQCQKDKGKLSLLSFLVKRAHKQRSEELNRQRRIEQKHRYWRQAHFERPAIAPAQPSADTPTTPQDRP